jgi:hypothetical protein
MDVHKQTFKHCPGFFFSRRIEPVQRVIELVASALPSCSMLFEDLPTVWIFFGSHAPPSTLRFPFVEGTGTRREGPRHRERP